MALEGDDAAEAGRLVDRAGGPTASPAAAAPGGGGGGMQDHAAHDDPTSEQATLQILLEEDKGRGVDVAEDEPHRGAVEGAIEGISADPQQRSRLGHYFAKWRGGIDTRLGVPRLPDLFWSWLGAALGIAAISAADSALLERQSGLWLAASFGASAVLVYGVPESKLSQPRCLLGGHLVSALIGVLVRLAFQGAPPGLSWLANALAMSLALLAMQLTRTTHPPGGATALIATTAPYLAWQGFQLLVAVALDGAIMLAIALVVNNLPRDRAYPTYWWMLTCATTAATTSGSTGSLPFVTAAVLGASWSSAAATTSGAGAASDSDEGGSSPQAAGRFMAGRARRLRQSHSPADKAAPFMSAQAAVLSDGCAMSEDGCSGAPVLHSIATERRRRHSSGTSAASPTAPGSPGNWVWSLALQSSMM